MHLLCQLYIETKISYILFRVTFVTTWIKLFLNISYIPFLFEQALGQYKLALATQYLVQNILNNKKSHTQPPTALMANLMQENTKKNTSLDRINLELD